MMHGSRPALRRAASALAGRRPLSLRGATVLVTGGASGIGRLIALGAARAHVLNGRGRCAAVVTTSGTKSSVRQPSSPSEKSK